MAMGTETIQEHNKVKSVFVFQAKKFEVLGFSCKKVIITGKEGAFLMCFCFVICWEWGVGCLVGQFVDLWGFFNWKKKITAQYFSKNLNSFFGSV